MSLLPRKCNIEWNDLLEISADREGFEIFKHVMNIAPKNYSWEIKFNRIIVNFFSRIKNLNYSIAPVNYPWAWNKFALAAIRRNNRELFDIIRLLAPMDYEWDWNFLISKVAQRGERNQSIINYIRALAEM